MIRKPFHREAPRQIREKQMKKSTVMRIPEHIHLLLPIVGNGRQRLPEVITPRRPIHGRVVVDRLLTPVHQFVQKERMRREVIRCPTARRDQTSYGRSRVGILL